MARTADWIAVVGWTGATSMLQRDLRLAAKSAYVRFCLNPVKRRLISMFLHSGLKFDGSGLYVQLHGIAIYIYRLFGLQHASQFRIRIPAL